MHRSKYGAAIAYFLLDSALGGSFFNGSLGAVAALSPVFFSVLFKYWRYISVKKGTLSDA